MPAEADKKFDKQVIPEWNTKGEFVLWGIRTIPAETFCAIDTNILFLWHCLVEYPLWSSADKSESKAMIIETTYSLASSLNGLSAKAFVEAFHVSLAFQRFLRDKKEVDKEWARAHLLRIRRLLYLDHLFPEDQAFFKNDITELKTDSSFHSINPPLNMADPPVPLAEAPRS